MKKPTFLEVVGYLGLLIMTGIWTGFAWHILLTGGFTKSYRHSRNTIYIDGGAAIFIAYILLILAAVTIAMLLKRLDAPRFIGVLIATILLATPFVFLIQK